MDFLRIPPEVWRLKLDPVRAMLLALIHNIKGCYMSNDSLADEINVSRRTIQTTLNSLIDDGYITRSDSSKYKTGRIFYSTLADSSDADGVQNLHPDMQNLHPDMQNLHGGGAEFAPNSKYIRKNTKEKKESTASPIPLSETITQKSKQAQKPKISLENYGFTVDERQCVERWVEFRRQLKKPLTQVTLDSQVKKWGKDLSAVMDQSIENGWTGLFPLKSDGNNSSHKSQDKATQAYVKLSAAANRQDKTELNRLCEADPRIVQAIAAQGIKPKAWLLNFLQLDNDYRREADRKAFVAAYNSVVEGN